MKLSLDFNKPVISVVDDPLSTAIQIIDVGPQGPAGPQGVQGNQLFNYVRYWTDFPTFAGNRSIRMVTQSWEPGKTDAKLPILRSNDNISNQPSTYYLEDGSYFRMKNIQLNYSLPKTLLKRVGIGSATVYVQGQNLITATK